MERVGVRRHPGYRWKALGELSRRPHEGRAGHERKNFGIATTLWSRDAQSPSFMSDDGDDADEAVFEGCYICKGANERARRSVGSPVCKFTGCIKEHSRRRNDRAPIEGRTALAPPAKAARTACFAVREVIGIDLCVAASERQKRAGRPLDDDNISYKVRGGFGEDEEDELIPDTRWVTLSELVANMDESELTDLDVWAGKLKKAAQAARKRLRERE